MCLAHPQDILMARCVAGHCGRADSGGPWRADSAGARRSEGGSGSAPQGGAWEEGDVFHGAGAMGRWFLGRLAEKRLSTAKLKKQGLSF